MKSWLLNLPVHIGVVTWCVPKKHQSKANLCTDSFLLVTVVGSRLKPHWFENPLIFVRVIEIFVLTVHKHVPFLQFLWIQRAEACDLKTKWYYTNDQITLIPNYLSYLSTWIRLCSLSRFRGVMRFLKEFAYKGKEKETLDNHTRKIVLCDLQVAPIKTFFFLLRWKGERREIIREKSLSNILIAVSEIGIVLVKERIMTTLSLWIFIVHHIKSNSIIQQFLGKKL